MDNTKNNNCSLKAVHRNYWNRLKVGMAVVFTTAIPTFTFAQSYTNVPNDTITMVGIMEDLQTLSIQQVNVSSGTIQLKWQKVSETVPLLWEASVCDNAFCNTSLVDSGAMSPVIPGEYGLVLLHFTPHVNYGTAVVRYAVWDASNAKKKDTLTYILTVNANSEINKTEIKNTFTVYPNPAKNNINISSNLQKGFIYKIIDLAGKEILNGNSKTNTMILSTENLPNGIYHISISDNLEHTITKKILIQH